MKVFKKYAAIFLAVLLPTCSTLAQDITLKATAQRVVEAGTYFQLKFETNAPDVNSASLTPPNMPNDVNVVAGPAFSTMTSIHISNGRQSQSFSNQYTYTLLVEKEGKYTIGEASLSVDGKVYKSSPITIEVIKGSPPQNQQQGGQQQQQQGSTSAGTVSNDDVFVVTTLSKSTAYKGECIVATVKIYIKPDVVVGGLENYKFPTFNGFYNQDLDPNLQPEFTTVNYNGRVYNHAVLKRYILYPQQSGTLTVDPFETTAVVLVRSNSRSMFDDFFGSPTQQVRKKLTSPTLKVAVKELPAGAPALFTGAVGDFKVESSLSKNEVTANNALSLFVKVSGTGNMKLFEAPKPTLPADFEVYDGKTTDNLKNSAAGITGSRQFETPFVPRSAGNFTISPIEFCYFSPTKNQYVTIRTNELELAVEKDATSNQSTVVTSNTNQQAVRQIDTDIRSIKTAVPAWQSTNVLFASMTYYTIYGLLLVLFVILWYFLKERKKKNQNVALTRHRKANSMAKKRLVKASKLLQSNAIDEFYEELLRAYWGYLSDKLGMPVSELSRNNIKDVLASKQVDAETIDSFIAVVDECEFARYAPGRGKTEMEGEYTNAIEIITKLEQKIR